MLLPERMTTVRSAERPRVDQGLCQTADAVERRGVGQPAPVPLVVALGEERAIGRGGRPVLEAVGDPIRERAQRVRRPRADRPVGGLFDEHVGGQHP